VRSWRRRPRAGGVGPLPLILPLATRLPAVHARIFAGITGAYETAENANEYGIEASYNQYLEQHESSVRTLGQLFSQHLETDDVVLTVSTKLQAFGMKELAATKEPGVRSSQSDPRSGAVLAMAQYPSFDPNKLAVHNRAAVVADKAKLTNVRNGDSPLYNIPTFVEDTRPAQPFRSSRRRPSTTTIPLSPTSSSSLPRTYAFPRSGRRRRRSTNYGGGVCPPFTATLAQVLLMSCDTTFSELGVKLGAENLALQARAYGFKQRSPYRPAFVRGSRRQSSRRPRRSMRTVRGLFRPSAVRRRCDGAADGSRGAAVGDNGVIMQPYLVAKAESTYGNDRLSATNPTIWRRATPSKTAVQVRNLMLGVTQNPAGTAYASSSPTTPKAPATDRRQDGHCRADDNTLCHIQLAGSHRSGGLGQTPNSSHRAVVPVPQKACAAGGFNPTGATIAGPVLAPVLQMALRMAEEPR